MSKGAAHKLPKAIYVRGIQRQVCTNSPNPSANPHCVLRIPPTSLALGHLPLTREAWVLPHQCLFRGNDKLGALYLLSNILYPISPISHPVLSKIDTGINSQLPGNTKNVLKIMQNARKTMALHGFLGISYIKSPKNLYKLTLSPESKIWYVIRGVLWVYCAHGAHRFFRGTRSPSGAKKAGCTASSGLSPPEGGCISLETAGVTPWGFPNQSENE